MCGGTPLHASETIQTCRCLYSYSIVCVVDVNVHVILALVAAQLQRYNLWVLSVQKWCLLPFVVCQSLETVDNVLDLFSFYCNVFYESFYINFQKVVI